VRLPLVSEVSELIHEDQKGEGENREKLIHVLSLFCTLTPYIYLWPLEWWAVGYVELQPECGRSYILF